MDSPQVLFNQPYADDPGTHADRGFGRPRSEWRRFLTSAHHPSSYASALLLVAGILLALGVVMVASAGVSLDRPLLAEHLWRTAAGRQMIFAVVGAALIVLTGYLAVPLLGSEQMQRWLPRLLFFAVIAALVAAQIPGIAHPQRGSSRWLYFSIGGVQIGGQPSELAKLAMVALLASLLAGRNVDPRSFRRCFLPSAVAIGVSVALVGLEDFGTAALLGSVGATVLLVAGCRFRHLSLLALAGAGGFGVLLWLVPYRVQRLTSFLDIWQDPKGTGYQAIQSLATIVSGGWLGTGLGGGVQKYGYLPECHSDFIFSVICEEAGFFGGVMIIALFCLYVWLGWGTMQAALTRFERLLAFGLSAMIGFQAAMNIAVVTVMTPTTGISLPFVSAGGSGIITYSLATGILIAIARRSRTAAMDVTLSRAIK